MTETNGTVTYSVRELLSEIKDKLEAIDEKLDSQVIRITTLEASASAKRDFNLLWLPTVFSFIGVLILGALTWLKR